MLKQINKTKKNKERKKTTKIYNKEYKNKRHMKI